VAGITAPDLMALEEQSYSDAANDWFGAQSWAQLIAAVEENISYLDSNVQAPVTSWTGMASQLATGRVSSAKGSLISSHAQLTKIQNALDTFSNGIHSILVDIQDERSDDVWYDFFKLENSGALSYQEPYPSAAAVARAINSGQPGSANAAQVEAYRQTTSAFFTALVDRANRLDDETAAELRKLVPTPLVVQSTPTPARVPAPKPAPSVITSVLNGIETGLGL
jgi:hypothetical protein